jgi:T-complex protein 1 subunit zeta
MVEVMHMRHKLARDSRLVRGLVLDHGARHPDMPRRLEGEVFILTANIGLEYERSEVNAGFFYSSADQRERLVAAERGVTDARVQAVIDLKNRVCTGPAGSQGFVLVNQKGIDPPALDALAGAGILALRRAKRRNMERLVLACGGLAVNSVEELADPGVLGRAGLVWEHTLGDEKYTFIEDVPTPKSCTILIKGPDDHTLAQVKDAVRDGLRAVKNAIDDGGVVPGGGAFEAAAARHLRHGGCYASAPGRAKLGVAAFADALLAVPKTLAENAGHAGQDAVLALDAELEAGAEGVGVDLATGGAADTGAAGVWDAVCVKRQVLQSAPVVAGQLLLVDEVLRAGANMRKAG